VIVAVLLVSLKWWGDAALLMSLFLAHRLFLAYLATSVLRRFGVPPTSVWPGWLLIPSVVVLAMMKVLGVAVGVYVVGSSRRSAPYMYQR
jgi:hypothetical protein